MKTRTLAIFVALNMASSLWAGKAPEKTPKMLEKGKASYTANCISCHGANGDGNGDIGKLLNPKPRDFAKAKFKKGEKVDQVFATITNGLDGTAMAKFGHLSEEDRWALAYYVKSFKK